MPGGLTGVVPVSLLLMLGGGHGLWKCPGRGAGAILPCPVSLWTWQGNPSSQEATPAPEGQKARALKTGQKREPITPNKEVSYINNVLPVESYNEAFTDY